MIKKFGYTYICTRVRAGDGAMTDIIKPPADAVSPETIEAVTFALG